MKYKFQVTGLNKMLTGVSKFGDNVLKGLDSELANSAETIVVNAQAAVPKNTGSLQHAIGFVRESIMKYDIYARKNYAPYVEFGTGGLVDVPQGLEAYAIQFKGAGIREVNLPARPYLFPAYEAERVKLIERLKKDLLNEAKRGITVIMPGPSNITRVVTI